MAGSKSDYFENALLDYVFRGVSLGLGGSLYTFRTARDSFEPAKLTTGEFNEP